MVCFVFETGLLCVTALAILDSSVNQASLKLTEILLPLSAECWNQRSVLRALTEATGSYKVVRLTLNIQFSPAAGITAVHLSGKHKLGVWITVYLNPCNGEAGGSL